MSKKYDSNQTLQQKILEGVNILADNVASTLGPRGRNVILHQKGKGPIITKDGVTVASFVELDDPIQNLGAQIIKEASTQTNNVAGDGTTTATVIARSILQHAQKYISAGVPPIEIKRGVDRAVEAVCIGLDEIASPVKSLEEVENVATISANGDSNIGKMIAMAMDAIGKDGTVTIEQGRSTETVVDIIEGFRFEGGFCANAFVTDERKNIAQHRDVLILVTDCAIESVEQMLPTLELAARSGKPLIVVADSIEGQALAALIMNTVRGTMRVVGVKPPAYGEERRNILSDLAAATGATFITRETSQSLQEIKLEHLGTAESIEVLKNSTTVVAAGGDPALVDDRIESLKNLIKQTDDMMVCERIQERIMRLSSAVAVIKVGAPTEIEMTEKKHRIEDALEAVRSAQLEGVVAGGGTALIRASRRLGLLKTITEGEQIGVNILKAATRAPLRQMATNAGQSADIVMKVVEKQRTAKGYDFSSDKVVNMIEAGIIDPVKVTKTALRNAASVASTLITTNYAIVDVE